MGERLSGRQEVGGPTPLISTNFSVVFQGDAQYREIINYNSFIKSRLMKHKFNPENKKKLFSELRKKTLPAHKTLKEVGLKEGMNFADVGLSLIHI